MAIIAAHGTHQCSFFQFTNNYLEDGMRRDEIFFILDNTKNEQFSHVPLSCRRYSFRKRNVFSDFCLPFSFSFLSLSVCLSPSYAVFYVRFYVNLLLLNCIRFSQGAFSISFSSSLDYFHNFCFLVVVNMCNCPNYCCLNYCHRLPHVFCIIVLPAFKH